MATPRWFLREWRKHRRLTQQQLADLARLSKPFISQLESGERQYTEETLGKLAAALGVEIPDLIIRDPSRPTPLWALVSQMTPQQQDQGAEILAAFIRTTKPSK